jgi:hypothetical protein
MDLGHRLFSFDPTISPISSLRKKASSCYQFDLIKRFYGKAVEMEGDTIRFTILPS